MRCKLRRISKDLSLTIGGSPQGFRLTKPDAFSGAEILRLLLRSRDITVVQSLINQRSQPAKIAKFSF